MGVIEVSPSPREEDQLRLLILLYITIPLKFTSKQRVNWEFCSQGCLNTWLKCGLVWDACLGMLPVTHANPFFHYLGDRKRSVCLSVKVTARHCCLVSDYPNRAIRSQSTCLLVVLGAARSIMESIAYSYYNFLSLKGKPESLWSSS